MITALRAKTHTSHTLYVYRTVGTQVVGTHNLWHCDRTHRWIVSFRTLSSSANHPWLLPWKPKHTSCESGCFHRACCNGPAGWPSYLFSWGAPTLPPASAGGRPTAGLRGPQGLTLGDRDCFGSRRLSCVLSPRWATDKNISCRHKLFVVLLSQPCWKERTANDQCQTNLLQLTCAVNVEPSDPNLDGNHCKYFPATSVEEAFSWASQQGI